MSSAATVSRGARGLALAGAGFLVCCTLAAFAEEPRGAIVALGLYGFVFHTVFGKAYGLLPAYFDRGLAVPRAPLAQLPLSVLGAFLLSVTTGSTAAETLPIDADTAGEVGALLWAAGAVIFLATITLLSIAVVGHAIVVGLLVYGAPAPKLGAYGVIAGAIGGVATVAAGALIGLGEAPELLGIHPRLGLLGFLGLTILGVIYYFYPPAVAGDRGDDVATASLGLFGGGLLIELLGVIAGEGRLDGLAATAIDAGRGLAVLGALAYAGLLVAIVYQRYS